MLLNANNLHKSYHDGENTLPVLRGATLVVEKGEAIAVIGMSGSGKSTLLHLLGGLDVPDQGEITIAGENISSRPLNQLHTFRNRQIGYVFQFHHLLPEFSALENVMLPGLIAERPTGEVEKSALQTLDRLGLKDRARHRPAKLSGGEQQRVALARALINEPALLLADEPTGNLDIHTGEKVIELMWDMTVNQQRGLVIVTHEPTIAARANKVYRLVEGRLQAVTADELAQLLKVRDKR